jgi:hypothetical protein
MHLLPFLLADLLSHPPLPNPESLASLSRLLKAVESPANESGEVVVSGRELTAPEPKNREWTGPAYRYRIHGSKVLVTTLRDQIAWVWCLNDRLDYVLVNSKYGWALHTYGPVFSVAMREIDRVVLPKLACLHALQRITLSELLLDPAYQVVLTRPGPRDYQVSGGRPGSRLAGVQATVRVAASGRSAYIASATSTTVEATKLSETGRRDEVEERNVVREDPDRPRLVESLNSRVATVDGVVYRYEYKARVQSRVGVTDDELKEFELAHYGLTEPERPMEDWTNYPDSAPPDPDKSAWLVPTVLILVVLVIVGGYLLRSRRPTGPTPGQ